MIYNIQGSILPMSFFLVSGDVEEIIQQAKTKCHKNLYLNYQHLTELPSGLLQLDKAEKLYLKYNILKKLVRIIIGFVLPENIFTFCKREA